MKPALLIIAFLCSLIATAQVDIMPEPIHLITIYKSVRDVNENKFEVVLNIDEKGYATTERIVNGETQPIIESDFRIKNLGESLFKFINGQKVPLLPAYDDIDDATMPETGEQVLHITIVTVACKNAQGDHLYPAEYFIVVKAKDNELAPQALFKYLGKDEAESFRKLLN